MEQPEEGTEENANQQHFDTNGPNLCLLDIAEQVTGRSSLPENARPQQSRAHGKEHGAQGNDRPEQAAQDRIPLAVLQQAVVSRIIEIEHFEVGAVAEMMPLVGRANQAER